MDYKRITLLCGHYGSGKTNVAVNMALDLKKQYENVAIADLDIVNPYFRTKDSAEELGNAEIQLIASEYAGTNVDIPAMPQQMYAITANKNIKAIIDVGGDDRGALALGRIADAIKEENDYEMIFVINCYRPLTRDAKSTIEVMNEIETACNIKFTSIINNSNLGEETKACDVINSLPYAEEVSKLTGLPIKCTTVHKKLLCEVQDVKTDVFPLELQQKIH